MSSRHLWKGHVVMSLCHLRMGHVITKQEWMVCWRWVGRWGTQSWRRLSQHRSRHDFSVCEMTSLRVTWVVYVRLDSSRDAQWKTLGEGTVRDVTLLYVTWLFDMWHDSFIFGIVYVRLDSSRDAQWKTLGEVGGWGRVPFSRNLMSPTPRRKWYLTTGRRFH